MQKKVYVLSHRSARENAARSVVEAPDGCVVTIEERLKSRDQEALYHATLSEIAKTRTFMGKKWDQETWKRLLVDAYARIKAEEGEPIQGHGMIVPNLDHTGFVQLGVQTRKFTKKQASEFIEFLNAWMAQGEE